MKRMINFNDYPAERAKEFEETRGKIKKALADTDKMESEVRKFKYYQTISEYSSEVLNMYFNEYPPLSTIELIKVKNININSLSHLADSLKADYIVCYHNIHSGMENNRDILKLTTVLYSNSDHKILFEKETTGDTDSRGDMWSCTYPLSCLLVSGIKTSTDLIFSVIEKRQHK